ncbi:hypothetical protein [Pseudofrankia asymbiotica]
MISGAAGGAPNVVRPGETGLVVDDPDVAAVDMLLADPARQQR